MSEVPQHNLTEDIFCIFRGAFLRKAPVGTPAFLSGLFEQVSTTAGQDGQHLCLAPLLIIPLLPSLTSLQLFLLMMDANFHLFITAFVDLVFYSHSQCIMGTCFEMY